MSSSEPEMVISEDLPLDEEEVEAADRCGYSKEEASAFKGVYNHYDQNFGKGDGKCSVSLVKSMVRALGISLEKKDEEVLAQMLIDVDENKDGSCQFPEFLLLIHKMQQTNFCGMNDAAAQRVKAEQIKQEKKEKALARRNSEKAAHRASLTLSKETAAKLQEANSSNTSKECPSQAASKDVS